MGRRVGAAVAAIAMVVLALVVRGQLDKNDNAPSTGTGALKLLCATELAQSCQALDDAEADVTVVVEPAAVTAERLAKSDETDTSFDGWLAPGPWRDVVEASGGSTGELFSSASVLARSPFVLAVWKDKRVALQCPEPLDLGCVGDAVNARGFRLGVAADTEAEGVLADAALAAGHIDNPNFASNDFGETDLAEWLTGVDQKADSVGQNPGGRSFTELLTFGAANADGYLSTEANIGPQLSQASRRNELELLYVRPVTTADVMFVSRRGSRGGDLRRLVDSDRMRRLLSENGWRVDGEPPAPGVNATPRLGADDALPSGGVLHELIEITR